MIIRVLIVSSILGCMLVNGLPSGAPSTACSTIRPSHGSNTPSSLPVPYTVDLSAFPTRGYVPGQNYNIVLRGSSSNRDFKGFLVQGRVRASDSPAGSFGSGTNYQSQCTGNSAATHTNRNEKTTVTLVWTAPPAGTGCICFRYAFVDRYALFWANQITQCISENLPQTSIQASSSGSITGNNFTISLTANVDGEFQCSLDGASFKSCSSGDVFPNLSVGTHRMNVQFTPAGSCEAFALQPAINISIAAPTPAPTTRPITVSINGSVSVDGNTATITLNNNFDGVFQCSLDGGAFENCASGDTFTGLSDGAHTIDVRFTPEGTSQMLSFQLRFTIASVTTVTPAPTPTEIRASGSATVSGNSVNLTLTSNFPGAFECSLDGGSFQPCSTGTTYTGLSVGDHMIVIRFTPSGSSQSSTLNPALTFTIAPTPTPAPELTLDVRVTIAGTKLTVDYSISESATCTCQLNSGTPVACNPGHMYNNVAPGDHTVTVACSTGSTMISKSVDVSVSEEEAFVITGWYQVSGNDVQVFFNSTLPARFKCKLDNGRNVNCVSGHTYMDLSAGRHRIRLTARLRSNRRTRKMLNLRRFTIQPSQTTAPPPPAPPQVTTSADVINNCNVRLRFSADVPSTFRCRVNGGPWKPCSDGFVASDLPPGANEIEIEASTVQDPRVRTVVKATVTLPAQACSVLEITCPVCNPSVVADNLTFTFDANKPNVDFSCSLNDKRPTPCNEGSVSYSDLRRNKEQKLTVTASTCNGEMVSKNFTFASRYNSRFCQVYICGDGVSISGDSATVNFLCDDPDASFDCRLDGSRLPPCTSPLQLSDLSSGSHELEIRPVCTNDATGRRERITFTI